MRGPLVIALVLLLLARASHAAPGDPDPTFNGGGVVTLAPSSNTLGGYVATRPDGGVVVVSTADDPTTFFFPDRERIVVQQLRADGSLDPDFADGGTGYYVFEAGQYPDRAAPQAFVRQPDGELLIAGGSATSDPPGYHLAFLRLLADGTPDAEFGTNGVVLIDPLDGESVKTLLVEPDGHILLGSDAAFDDHREFVVRRFDAQGAPDASFGDGGVLHIRPDAATSNQLQELARQDDGTIVLAGVGISLEAGPITLTSALARIHIDGSVDDTFGDGGAVVLANQKWPISVAVTNAGQLLVGTTDFSVFRLSADGALDTTYGDAGYAHASFFFSARGLAPGAISMAVDPAGRVLLGGFAPSPQGVYAYALTRFTADGRQDLGFGPSGVVLQAVGLEAQIMKIALQVDGRIVVGGYGSPPGPSGNILGIAQYEPDGPDGGPCAAGAGTLLLRRLTEPLGDEIFAVTATFAIAPDTMIDPVANRLRLRMAGVARPLLDVAAPSGPFTRANGRGWTKRKAPGLWTFADKTGETSVRSVVVHRVGARKLRVSARVQTYVDVSTAVPPFLVRFEFADGTCGDVTFATGRCKSEFDGDRLLCR